MFGLAKKVFGAAAKEVKADYSGNKDFLEAVSAGAALVAFSDGSSSDDEKSKTIKTMKNHPVLGKMYSADEIEKTVDTMFKRAVDGSGRQLLARELDDIKGREGTMADDVYLIASDVAASDGTVDPKEQATLDKIANRLGVDVSKFDF
jgi:tellurite resistance protein TerB